MYISKITLLVVLNLFVMTAIAQSEGGHYHGPRISEEEAKVEAKGVVKKLVGENKIDGSWTLTEPGSSSQRTFEGHLEWVVTFRNDTIEDETKRTLYVFLTLGGEYTGANYTGQ
jgi:hypothetical protein